MALLQQQCERYNLGRRTKFLNVAPSASGESARGQAGLSDQVREEVEPDSAAYQVLPTTQPWPVSAVLCTALHCITGLSVRPSLTRRPRTCTP